MRNSKAIKIIKNFNNFNLKKIFENKKKIIDSYQKNNKKLLKNPFDDKVLTGLSLMQEENIHTKLPYEVEKKDDLHLLIEKIGLQMNQLRLRPHPLNNDYATAWKKSYLDTNGALIKQEEVKPEIIKKTKKPEPEISNIKLADFKPSEIKKFLKERNEKIKKIKD